MINLRVWIAEPTLKRDPELPSKQEWGFLVDLTSEIAIN